MCVSAERIVERASTRLILLSRSGFPSVALHPKEIPAGLNAEEVIRHVGLSHTQVERAFVKVLGNTIHQEIARLRML
jgi:AraC-like DNA-binding protein